MKSTPCFILAILLASCQFESPSCRQAKQEYEIAKVKTEKLANDADSASKYLEGNKIYEPRDYRDASELNKLTDSIIRTSELGSELLESTNEHVSSMKEKSNLANVVKKFCGKAPEE